MMENSCVIDSATTGALVVPKMAWLLFVAIGCSHALEGNEIRPLRSQFRPSSRLASDAGSASFQSFGALTIKPDC